MSYLIKEREILMISVKVKPYCEDCPDFSAEVESYNLCAGGKIISNHTIRCKHQCGCERIEKYIQTSLEQSKGE